MKITSSLLIIASITCILNACNQTNEVKNVEANATSPLNTTSKTKFATLPRAINWDAMNPSPNPEEFVTLEKDFTKAQLFIPSVTDVSSLKSFSLAWREVEPKVKAFLAGHSNDHFASYYRQKCALEMLCATDLMVDASSDALPVIAHYTNMLDKEQNSSIAVMHQALNRLGKYWSADQTNRIAMHSIRKAESNIASSKEQRLKLPLNKEMKADLLKGEQENYKYVGLIRQIVD